MSSTEIDLILHAQKGDEQAFEALYRLYYKQAYNLALKISNCDADAKDAAQETFIEIQRSIMNLKEPGSFKKWMYQIVISKCNKIFRKNKYTVLDPDIINSMEIEENRDYMTGKKSYEKKSRRDLLFAMMNRLTQHQKEILVLTYFEQLSIKEMAEILAIPEGTVKSRMVNAKSALKIQIQELGGRDQLYFRVIPFPLLLSLAYQNSILGLFHIKPSNLLKHGVFSNPVSVFIAVATCGALSVGAYSYYKEYNRNATSNISQSSPDVQEQVITSKDRYHQLKDWAHCHVEMSEKTQAEIQAIHETYEQLKKENGPYYHRLQLQNWAQDFESLK